jgi:hypothetical protein
LIFQWLGMVEYIPCYGGPAEHWGPLPATRLASRKILIEENIKKRTGPSLCVLCGWSPLLYIVYTHTVATQIIQYSDHATKILTCLKRKLITLTHTGTLWVQYNIYSWMTVLHLLQDKEAFIRSSLYDYNYDVRSPLQNA